MNLIHPNITFDNYYDKTKYIIARNIALFTSITLLISIYYFRFQDSEIVVYYIIGCGLTFGSFIFILFSKKYDFIFYALTLGGSLLVQISANTGSHMLHYGAFSWSLLATILAFFGLGVRFSIVLLIFNIIGVISFLFFFLDQNFNHLLEYTSLQKIGIGIEQTAITIIIGYVMYHFVLFHKHSEKLLKEKNKKLNDTVIENITLVKEIHHRVKNNLQIIISLLRLQKGELKSDEIKIHFNEAINRIMVMSLIHKKLYQEKELARINIQSYLTDLSEDIQSISDLGFPINIKITSEIESIGLKTIVPLGLLINELLTNSIKHAFINKQSGSINISIIKDKNNIFSLSFSDNGEWKGLKELNPSFGIELIGILTSQLEGDYKRISNDEGTKYVFYIKNIDIEK